MGCGRSRAVEQIQGYRSQRVPTVTRAQAARDLDVESDDHLFANPECVPGRGQALVALRRIDGEVDGLRRVANRVIEHGPLTIDLAKKRATIHGRPLELPQREHAILQYLFSNVDAVVGKDKIAGAVASWDEHISPNAIEVHISRLRAKLEPSGIRIRTIRGLGYLVEAWRDAEP